MTQRLHTPADLAEMFGVKEEHVLDLRRSQDWPCVQLSRKFIRFTDEHVEQIIAKHSIAGKPPEPEASAATSVATTGQTKRSASRRRRS